MVVWVTVVAAFTMPSTWQLSPRIAFVVGAAWVIGVALCIVINKLQDHEPAIIELDDESAQITLKRCMLRRRMLIKPGSGIIPYRGVQRVDLRGSTDHGTLTLRTTEGTAVVSRSITKVDELVQRLDALALDNKHDELYVTMGQLRWRRFLVWLVVCVIGGAAMITLLAWFIHR